MIEKLVKVWPLVVAVVSLLAWAGHALLIWQEHLITEQRRCERIALLERIFVSEHPQYSQTFFYPGATQC